MTIELQQRFWNAWNAAHREHGGNEVSRRQAEVVGDWFKLIGRHDLRIIEVGCGAAWLTPSLMPFGTVTATDLANELIERAQIRFPAGKFIAGDFMALDFDAAPFDVAVTLEVLSHVADQSRFISKIAGMIKPGGYLMLATQNRPVLQRYNRIPPPAPGQLRRWVDAKELRVLLQPQFDVLELYAVTPRANRGFMRLIASYKVNTLLKALVGNRIERFWERRGFGWTLMALARRRFQKRETSGASGEGSLSLGLTSASANLSGD